MKGHFVEEFAAVKASEMKHKDTLEASCSLPEGHMLYCIRALSQAAYAVAALRPRQLAKQSIITPVRSCPMRALHVLHMTSYLSNCPGLQHMVTLASQKTCALPVISHAHDCMYNCKTGTGNTVLFSS